MNRNSKGIAGKTPCTMEAVAWKVTEVPTRVLFCIKELHQDNSQMQFCKELG